MLCLGETAYPEKTEKDEAIPNNIFKESNGPFYFTKQESTCCE